MQSAPPDNRIHELRTACGLSQDEVARRINTTAAQIQKLETGARRLTLDWMRRLARALDVAPADLLVDADVPERLAPEERAIFDTVRRLDASDRIRLMRLTQALELAEQDLAGNLPPAGSANSDRVTKRRA